MRCFHKFQSWPKFDAGGVIGLGRTMVPFGQRISVKLGLLDDLPKQQHLNHQSVMDSSAVIKP